MGIRADAAGNRYAEVILKRKREGSMGKGGINNKGFSLVELVIVVAIMAILVVILAPQYVRYVERARNSADLQNAIEIVTALQLYASDPESEAATIPAEGSTGSITIAADEQDFALTTFEGAALAQAGLTKGADNTLRIRCQSRTAWQTYTITWEVVNGNLEFTYSSTPAVPAGGTDPFAARMTGGN